MYMQWHNFLKLLLIVIIVSALSLWFRQTVTAVAPIVTLDLYRSQTITNQDIPKIMKLVAEQENIEYEKLLKLAKCESTLRHYDKNNNVLTGYVNSSDAGVLQINRETWQDTANKLGYDILDPIDNCLMAAWIINNDYRGWENWVCYSD